MTKLYISGEQTGFNCRSWVNVSIIFVPLTVDIHQGFYLSVSGPEIRACAP